MIDRVTRISAPSLRACWSARLARRPPTPPMGSRGNSRFERTCRPGRRAPPARPRSCSRPSDAPYTAAAKPAGPAPTITVSYSAATGSVPRSSSSATLRWCGRITVLSSITRIAGKSSWAGRGPPHRSAASGVLGVSHLKVIWLRSRKRRSSAQDGIPAMPDHDRARRRRLCRDALQPSRSAHPVGRPAGRLLCDVGHHRRNSVIVVNLDAHDARSLRRAKAHRERGPERDRGLTEDVPRATLTDDALNPVDELDRLDATLENGEECSSLPSSAAYSPATRLMSAATREICSRSAESSAANSATSPISSVVTTFANPSPNRQCRLCP